MKKKGLPKFLQSALWSYDLFEFDSKDPKDQKILIQSVLNRGTDEQVAWVLNNFSEKEIKTALADPLRGSWWTKSLNYWRRILNLVIPSKKYEAAIQKINPQA